MYQKLGLTTIRHSCGLKEKRERHELIKPHDKTQETLHLLRRTQPDVLGRLGATQIGAEGSRE